MKKYLLLFLSVITFCLHLKAQENFLFLSLEQFEHLTASEQHQYVSLLQDLVIQFEQQKETSPQVRAVLKQFQFLIPFMSQAHAADDEVGSSKIRSPDTRIEIAKISLALNGLSLLTIAAQEHKNELNFRKNVAGDFIDIVERLELVSKKPMSFQEIINFQSNIKNLQDRYTEALTVAPNLINMKSDVTKLVAASKKLEVSQKISPTVGKNPIARKKSETDPRCIYSGFVITEVNCSPLKAMPSEIRLQELKNSEFKCKSSNEILCNPLVFGYQSDLSPYCTTRSVNASKNCRDISNNSENLARIHNAWTNPANKKIFDDFQSSLKSLCDSENKSSDVKATCKIVVVQFNEKVKQEFPAQLAANSGHSKTDRSLKKN